MDRNPMHVNQPGFIQLQSLISRQRLSHYVLGLPSSTQACHHSSSKGPAMTRRRLLCFLVAASMLAAACGDENSGTGPGPGTNPGPVPGPEGGVVWLRVVHADALGSSLGALVDGAQVLTDLPYGTASGYLELDSGSHHVAFVNTSGTMSDLDMDFADSAAYTVIPCCTQFPLPYTLLTDGVGEPAAGNARIRVVDFASAAQDVDIYVTAPGADLAAATPTATLHITYASEYIEVPAGDHQVRITPSSSKTLLADSGPLTLGAGQSHTAIAVDAAGGGEPYGFLMLEDLD